MDLLVLGYGNTLRSDDAVGPLVANAIEELRLPGVITLSCTLLTPELADSISRARRVVFVDASVEGTPEVRLRPLSPGDSSQILAHAAQSHTLLALARDVFGHAPQSWWLTIPAENLELGENLSARAKQGMAEAICQIQKLQGNPKRKRADAEEF